MSGRAWVPVLLFTATLDVVAISGCSGSNDQSDSGGAGKGGTGGTTAVGGTGGGRTTVTSSTVSSGAGGHGGTSAASASSSVSASHSNDAGPHPIDGGADSSDGNGGGPDGSDGSASTQPFKGVANSPCAARTALNVSWYYNWTQKETEPCTNGQGGEFVPMIWGHTGAEQSPDSIRSAVSSFVSNGYKHVLGFNEPDNSSQSKISVTTAISLLPSFANPSILVGTPATQANTSGQSWFKDYMGQVNASSSLRADFIALHWYGWNAGSCDASASQLESYIKYAEGFAGNRPIWLTEWGCLNQSAPTASGVVDFFKGALKVFARHPRVQRYAWYPWSTNCELTNSDGSLTPLGVTYAAAPAYR